MLPTGRVSKRKRLVLIASAATLMFAGVAFATVPIGLQDPGFNSPLGTDGWTASTYRDGAYSPAPPSCVAESNRDLVYGYPDSDEVCQIDGSDTFTVNDDETNRDQTYTVSPLPGDTHMVRLGGPFNSEDQFQPKDHAHQIAQTFQVPSGGASTVHMAYDMYTFDYSAFDDFSVELLGPSGQVLYHSEQPAIGSEDGALAMSGWQPLNLNLTGLQGQTVTLKMWAGGTVDNVVPTWAYVDGLPSTLAAAPSTPVTGGSTTGPSALSVKHTKVKGKSVKVEVSCSAGTGDCDGTLKLTVRETKRGSKLIAVSARKHRKRKVTKTVNVASKGIKLAPGTTKTITLKLNHVGQRLLKSHHRLRTRLTVQQKLTVASRAVSSKTVTFKAPKKHHKKHHKH